MSAVVCDTRGCWRRASRHIRIACDSSTAFQTQAACSRCIRLLDAHDSRLSCALHDDQLHVGGRHPLHLPDCRHPDAIWHDQQCRIPSAGLTVRDLTHLEVPA